MCVAKFKRKWFRSVETTCIICFTMVKTRSSELIQIVASSDEQTIGKRAEVDQNILTLTVFQFSYVFQTQMKRYVATYSMLTSQFIGARFHQRKTDF